MSAGDFAEVTARLAVLVRPGRRLFLLEGGYDLDALAGVHRGLRGRPDR